VLLQGGEALCRNDTDHETLFRQESFFHWTFGVMEPNCFGTMDLNTGKSTLFVPRLPAEYAVVMGKIHSCEDFQKCYHVDAVQYVDELLVALTEAGTKKLLVLKGLNTDSGAEAKPAAFVGSEGFEIDIVELFPQIVECRVIKSPAEIEVLHYACKVTSDAHLRVMRACHPGLHEYDLESLFKYQVYSQGGCRHCSYTCICASGFNGATLHYGHAGAPNNRRIRVGDTMLMDMGCEYHCYCSDITCSFPASGQWSEDQRAAYTAVMEAVGAVEKAMKPGVVWSDMHYLAAKVLLEHLVGMGLLQGDINAMMVANVWECFFPCGLGHFIGCDTHDVGGYPTGEAERINRPGIRKLRTTRILQEGMVLTVEPGLYFTDIQLDRALKDSVIREFVVPERLKQFYGFGGFRIEDQVVVTADGIEHMEQLPRDVATIEAICQGSTSGTGLRCDGRPLEYKIDVGVESGMNVICQMCM